MFRITQVPPELQEFLSVATESLNRYQKAHLVVYLLGLLLGFGRGNVSSLSRLRTDGRHRTGLSHFLSRSPWDAASVVQRMTLWEIEQMRQQPGDPCDPDNNTIFPILDDTKQEKPGKGMAGRQKLYDSSNDRFIQGTDVVTCVLRFRGKVFPWASVLALSEEQAAAEKRPHKTTVQIAATMITNLTLPSGLKVVVLFDTAYLADEVVQAVDSHEGWVLVSRAKTNRVVITERGRRKADGKPQHIGRYMRNCLRRGTHYVDIGSGKTARRCQITVRTATLQNVGKVKIVFSILVRIGKKWVSHDPIAIVTTDLEASEETILRYLSFRWSIEQFFKVVKQYLGWSQYQTRTLVGAERHLCLVSLAHALLTHLELRKETSVARRQTLRTASTGQNFHDTIRRLVGAEAMRQARTRGLNWLQQVLGLEEAA